MAALRNHKLFHSLQWGTLWADPPPALEAGLLKKVHPLSPKQPDAWDHITDSWDQLAEREDALADDDKDDEIPWAADARGPSVLIKRRDPVEPQNVEIGPMGEIRAAGAEVIKSEDGSVSSATMSPASSADSSPMGRLNDKMAHLQPFQAEDSQSSEPTETIIAKPNGQVSEPERGRSPMQTPVQGHGPPVEL